MRIERDPETLALFSMAAEYKGASKIRSLRTGTLREEDRVHRLPIISVCGATGVGKSFIIDRALKKLSTEGLSVKPVGMGDLLVAATGRARDDIKNMELNEYIEAKSKIGESLSKSHEGFILDSHIVTRHNENLWINFEGMEKQINASDYIVVMGDPKEIRLRIVESNQKGIRNRVEEPEEVIDFEQVAQFFETERLANNLGAGLHVVYNNIDETNSNVEFVVKVIRKAFSTPRNS